MTGKFSDFSSSNLPAGLHAILTYDAKDVFLNLTSGFATIGNLTLNQTAVATALDNALNNGGKSLTGLLPLSVSQFPAAFDILSGEGTSATQETAFAAGQQFTSLMMQQGSFWPQRCCRRSQRRHLPGGADELRARRCPACGVQGHARQGAGVRAAQARLGGRLRRRPLAAR